MKDLSDFKNELNKCSKCGLCQAVCPLYKLTNNECAVSKGKFTMLYGVVCGDLKLSKNINKYLDMCLKCGKCSEFCPSGIDAVQILTVAKHEYLKTSKFSKFIKIFQSKQVFDNIIKLGKIFSKRYRKNLKNTSNSLKLMYFKGCVNEIFPNTDKYISKIFTNVPIEIIEPDFKCCGLPFLTDGNLERFEQVAKHNSNLLSQNDYNYVITDCASCESTLNSYKKYIDCSDFSNKTISWEELIVLKRLHFKFKQKINVTYHKPCHQSKMNFIKIILDNCENVEYVEMEGFDECCGFAGSFALKNPSTSIALTKEKAKNITRTGADYVITTCPSCILGLTQGLFLTRGKAKPISLLQFLSMADVDCQE